ncbi:MAG: hypothetical protein RJA98_2581 [Pseudomonadota bacterium]|jgi:transcriptional regulator with XRE-family HTH domain
MTTDFGKRLAKAREDAGFTQDQLAELSGIAQSTIAAAERGGAGSRKTATLAKLCGVDAYWLETGEGTPNPQGLAIAEPSAIYLAPTRAAKPNLGMTILQLAQFLSDVSDIARLGIAPLLSELATRPEEAEELAEHITALASRRSKQAG